MRHIFQPPCSAEFKVCSSRWCSTVLPRLYSFDSITKSIISLFILLVIISSIGEMNSKFVLLTVPALCYAIGLPISACFKTSFNSSSYIRSYESLILVGNTFLCAALFWHALNFDQRPTKEDRTLKFTRSFTIWLCVFQIANTVQVAVSLVIQRAHYLLRHSPDEALRNRRFAELHRTFKDLRTARYGGLTSIPIHSRPNEASDGCAYFPNDKVPTGRSLSRPKVESDEAELFHHFLRCSCCIDNMSSDHAFAEYDHERNSSSTPAHLKSRSDARFEFLTRPGWQHLPQEYSQETFKAHSLCALCQNICCTSNIIQSRDSFNPSRHFGLFIREREQFEHYATPQQLSESVKRGCHLCTLIWASMSPGQHTSLLTADATLEAQRDQLLAITPNADERRTTENEYDGRRRIRLFVETFDRDITPLDSQIRRSHSLEVGKGAAQIVPHFGRFKRPRRWMSGIRNFQNQMLVEQGEAEFAAPILILRCDQNNSGPIKMPISDSTGSAYSMSLIRSWLHETESTDYASFLPGRVLHIGSALKFGFIRVLDQGDIQNRLSAAQSANFPSHLADECEHKFAIGCSNAGGGHCCACMAGEWSSNPASLNDYMEHNPYCPRCEGE